VSPPPRIDEEALEGREEECPEPTLLRVSVAEELTIEQPEQELLRQVAGVVGVASLPRANA
jgi:hypothetical protein